MILIYANVQSYYFGLDNQNLTGQSHAIYNKFENLSGTWQLLLLHQGGLKVSNPQRACVSQNHSSQFCFSVCLSVNI